MSATHQIPAVGSQNQTPMESLPTFSTLQQLKRTCREFQITLRIRHLFGVKKVHLADNEAAVTCVVKNGSFHLSSFIEHYTKMGFRHIFLLDNGSTDNTLAIARQHGNVTAYQCKLPVGSYQELFKKVLAERVAPSGWCLDVDIDEFFDYPLSNVADLSRFLTYLNTCQYSAVLVQMLDMFSDRPLKSLTDNSSGENLRETYRYYDLSDITKVRYRSSHFVQQFAALNRLGYGETSLYFGGTRKRLFGLECLLSKHSLFRTGRGLDLFTHVHFTNRAELADVSGTLLHYKFVSNAYDTAAQNRTAFPAISKGYQDFLHAIEVKQEASLKTAATREFRNVDELLESQFLFASAKYRQYASSGLLPAT